MSLVGSVDDIWSEVVLSGKENTWGTGGDAGNVWNFGGAVGNLSEKFLHFGLKGVATAESDWDEMKMIGNVFELKEGFTWVRKMEVTVWSMMTVINMMIIIVMMIVEEYVLQCFDN